MTVYILVLLPLIAATLFVLGIRLLLRILFRPILPSTILGIRMQGVIPAQMPVIADLVAAQAGKVLAESGLAEKAGDPSVVKGLMPGIESHIDGFLQQRLTEKVPVLAMFLSEQLMQTIRQSLVDEIELLLPNVIAQFAGKLEQQIDVESVVKNRLSSISATDLEERIRTNLKGPISKLQRGAFFWGLLTGLIQAGVVAWLLAR